MRSDSKLARLHSNCASEAAREGPLLEGVSLPGFVSVGNPDNLSNYAITYEVTGNFPRSVI